MKRNLLLLIVLVSIASGAMADDDDVIVIRKVAHVMEKPLTGISPVTTTKADTRRMARLKRAAENGLTANFGVKGSGEQQTIWAENFDNGTGGWTLENGNDGYVTWKTALMPVPSVEGDVQSLTLDVPYQMWKRENAKATSPEVSVPSNAVLHAAVYGGKVYNDYATLTISVSDDDFATKTEVWKSTAITESGSKWHAVECDLETFAGKTVKLRLEYGAGTKDDFNSGGYMYAYGIDNVSVTGVSETTHIDVLAGEEIHFKDLSSGNPASWVWHFPGGVPETSDEQHPVVYYTKSGSYDVTLTVADAEGEDVKTIEGFVGVTGKKPIASFDCPASFRDALSHLKMVAPLVPVKYHDTSTGFPTSWSWNFTNGPTSETDEHSTEQHPSIAYNFMSKQYAVLVADNDEAEETGEMTDIMTKVATDSVMPKYDGLICNLLDTDIPTTYDMGDDGKFPGACKVAGADLQGFAEKFSKPSRPILVYGFYVYASEASAGELYDQVMPVKFALTRSNNGMPGEVIDFDSWTIPEIGYAIQNNNGMVTVEFSKPHILDEEFFVTVTDLPEMNESLKLSFAMAPMRDKDNTAYMLKNGEWKPMTGYFQGAPGGQTSFYVYPSIAHSVITTLPVGTETVEVEGEGGITEQEIFSYLGYTFKGSNAEWCTVVNAPNGLTLDTLRIKCDPLEAEMESRQAVLTFSDGLTTITLNVLQHPSIVSGVQKPEPRTAVISRRYYTIDGLAVAPESLQRGVYMVRETMNDGTVSTRKLIVKE
ncbi:MAG: PKD domain-containing protein [Prevotella sp.]|uniref:PKD domain-containing protein n=1 Tax=Prevotella sp. TaxID=59823 RepID=UPI002A325926|nr:PKD domain-containing protein [Prevotella sp.]MDD7317343.1 PKD domain-containing protein [Prevotellaceae bacterium]MDY4019441.1 PKD domain-containing protein [Prevotella sp.]